MIYKFLIISDEADNFAREISIDSEATFLDLHDAILDSVKYTKDQLTSFFICDDEWEKKTEITLVDMNSSYEDDIYVMKDTRLSELLEDEKQRLLFIYDNLTERAFFMELREIVPGKNLEKPVCTKSIGIPPQQLKSFDDLEKGTFTGDLGENFYGDEEFDPSERDEEGYDNLDMSGGNSYEDEKY